jgi:hypothetical protein
MTNHVPRLSELPALVASVSQPAPDASSVTALVLVCQRMAAAYVRVKVMTTRFDPMRIGLSVEDFAFDAIAEMFRRDDTGRLTVFATAFGTLSAESQAQASMEHILRQMVFTAVNRQIFRSYRETDPSLAKLLRNIKNALRSHPTAAMAHLGGEWTIVPRRSIPLLDHLPLMTPELLAAELHALLSGPLDLRELLSTVAAILSEQTEYSRKYPLMGAALLIRGVYTRYRELEEEETLFDAMTDEELERFLRPALGNVLRSTGRKYIENGKVTEEELQIYARALFNLILDKVSGKEEEPRSLFELVVKYDPSMTKDEYLSRHRAILEYLLKLVRRELQELLQNEWEFPR